jgi:hypothetical protein
MIVDLSRRVFLRCIAAVVVAASPALRAQTQQPSTNYLLTVGTERPDALYGNGEEVSFQIKLLLDQKAVDEPEIQWTLSKDGVPPTRSGKVKLVHGTGMVTGKLDEPGFLQCQVTFATPAGRTLRAVAGAGIDPLQITPSLPVPDDFDAFWSAQKKKLAAVPVNPRLTPVKSPQGDVECFDLRRLHWRTRFGLFQTRGRQTQEPADHPHCSRRRRKNQSG